MVLTTPTAYWTHPPPVHSTPRPYTDSVIASTEGLQLPTLTPTLKRKRKISLDREHRSDKQRGDERIEREMLQVRNQSYSISQTLQQALQSLKVVHDLEKDDETPYSEGYAS